MYYYIVNPAAGNSAISSIQDKLKTNLHRLNIDGEFAKTIGDGDAAKIAKRALNKGIKTIVVVGGDATVNEVITAVHEARKPTIAVGIIPIGKRNTLATHLGIKDWQQACKVLSARRLQDYSLMSMNEHVFIYAAQAIPKPADENTATAEAFEYLLEIDGRYKVRGEASQLQAQNQKFLNPELTNQLVVHVYSKPASHAGLFSSLLQRLRHTEPLEPSFSQIHGAKVVLKCRSPALVTLDGRPIEAKKFEIALSEYQIRLISNRLTEETI